MRIMRMAETNLDVSEGQHTVSLSILQRLANNDRTAVKDCLETYGGLIWSLAKKNTSSSEEAESVTIQIFADIWRLGRGAGTAFSSEGELIRRIACLRLVICKKRAARAFR